MVSGNKWLALGALILAVLVVGLDTTVLNVALPTIAGETGADTGQLQWIVNAYVLAFAGAMLPAGILGDRSGRKKVLLIGLAVFLVGSVGGAVGTGVPLLIAMRALMGVGAATISPIVMALIPLMFDDEERPKAVGALAAAASLGLPLGLVVGGFLLDRFAWQAIFWINVPIVLAASVAVVALVGESRAPSAPRLDVVGAVVALLGVVALVYGFVEAPRQGWLSPTTIGLVLAGGALLGGFVARQARSEAPLVDLALFRDRRFVGGTVAVVLVTFVLYGLLFTLPLYLQAVRGNDALGTGLRLTPMMAGLIVAAAASKRLLARVGAARGTTAGLVVMAAALAALSAVSVGTGMVPIGAGLTLFGLGVGMAMTSAMDAVLGSLPRAEAGAGSGVTSTLRQIAGALGVAILGSILSSVYRRGLDAGSLRGLPAPAARAVEDSIVGATGVALRLGPGGDGLKRMADASYTGAMSTLLLVSAAAAIAAAGISGLVLRGRPAAVRAEPRPVGAEARES